MENRNVATKEEMEEMRRQSVIEHLEENKGRMVEVPYNLLYSLSHFLDATSNLLDEGRVLYPSMQWSCGSLSYLLNRNYVNHRSKIPGEIYALYDMIHEVNTRGGRDINRKALTDLFENGYTPRIKEDEYDDSVDEFNLGEV